MTLEFQQRLFKHKGLLCPVHSASTVRVNGSEHIEKSCHAAPQLKPPPSPNPHFLFSKILLDKFMLNIKGLESPEKHYKVLFFILYIIYFTTQAEAVVSVSAAAEDLVY